MQLRLALWVLASCASAADRSSLRVAHLERGQSALEAFPLKTVEHDKKAGQGYGDESPLYKQQQSWTSQNGQNSITGPLQSKLFPQVPAPWREVWITAYTQPWAYAAGLCLNLLVWFLVAMLYLRYKADVFSVKPEGKVESTRDAGWKHHFLDANCSRDWQLCLCALLCPGIRWADTTSTLQNPSEDRKRGLFWRFFLLFVILYVVAPFTLGLSLVLFIFAAVYFRQRMRAKFQHSPGKWWTIPSDLALWCFCSCCAIAQEAREIEHVRPLV